MNGRYVIRTEPTHPLSTKNGSIFEHRMVLYDAIGPGTHLCHWCGKQVTWHVRQQSGVYSGDLVVDHLDGNTVNNALTNLVPSCTQCNIRRNSTHTIQQAEQYVLRPSGSKARASECVCAVCNTTFLRINSSIVRDKLQYCSKTCANAALKKLRTHCKHGHELTPENTYIYKGNARCRLCIYNHGNKYNATHRAERSAAERKRQQAKRKK